MAVAGGPNIVEDGLVLALDAANVKSYQSGSTVWNDLTPSGYSATLANGTNFTGDVFEFDGSNDKINLGSRDGDSFTDTDDMTVSVFLKINNKNVAGVLGRFVTSASSDGWTIWVFAGKLIFFNASEAGYDPPHSNTGYSFTDGEWFHFSVTRDSTNQKLKWYVNGVLDQEHTTNASSYKKTNNGIAFGNINNDYFMNGSIGPCSIYNRALSASEVLQNYNATKGRFGL